MATGMTHVHRVVHISIVLLSVEENEAISRALADDSRSDDCSSSRSKHEGDEMMAC